MITYSIVQKMAKVGVLVTLSIVMSSVVLPLHIALAAPVTGGTGSAGACTPGTKGCDYVALTTIPGATVANQVTDPVKVIKNAYGVAIGIAAVLAVVMIIYAGIEYATVESISGHSDAKDRIMGALVGMGLLLASYIILRTINIDLVNVNLDLGTPIISDSKVKSDVLASINAQVNMNAQALGQAEALSAFTKKNADLNIANLQSQRDAIMAEAQKHADDNAYFDTPEGKLLKQKKDLIDKQIMEQQEARLNADVNILSKSISFIGSKGVDTITKTLEKTSALQQADVDNAKNTAETARIALDKKIAELKLLPGVSAADIKKAEGQAAVANIINQQYINLYTQANNVQEKSNGSVTEYVSSSISAYIDFRTNIQETEKRLTNSGVDKDAITNFKSASASQMSMLEKKLPITSPCPSDSYTKIYSGQSVGIKCAK